MNTDNIKVMKPVVINSIIIYQNWYSEDPGIGRTSYMPVLVLDMDDLIPLSLPANTVILRVNET